LAFEIAGFVEPFPECRYKPRGRVSRPISDESNHRQPRLLRAGDEWPRSRSVQGIGQVATTGAVFGFIMGAILGFVLSSTLAGTVFFFAQIERNTRSLLERERFEEPTQYRAAPRF
jgi:hypothetical protein